MHWGDFNAYLALLWRQKPIPCFNFHQNRSDFPFLTEPSAIIDYLNLSSVCFFLFQSEWCHSWYFFFYILPSIFQNILTENLIRVFWHSICFIFYTKFLLFPCFGKIRTHCSLVCNRYYGTGSWLFSFSTFYLFFLPPILLMEGRPMTIFALLPWDSSVHSNVCLIPRSSVLHSVFYCVFVSTSLLMLLLLLLLTVATASFAPLSKVPSYSHFCRKLSKQPPDPTGWCQTPQVLRLEFNHTLQHFTFFYKSQ